MKKIGLLIFVFICTFSISAQTDTLSKHNRDSISIYIANLLEDIDMRVLEMGMNNRYKLYPTENIYNFLKLDTRTGRIEQVQWSLDSDKEGTFIINSKNLSWGFDGLFELYPTQNMYQFLLLDKSDGRAWHVQWGLEDKKRWMRRIY